MGGVRFLLGLLLLQTAGCYWYKPELPTNKCQVNEDCPVSEWCNESRCQDIYFAD